MFFRINNGDAVSLGPIKRAFHHIFEVFFFVTTGAFRGLPKRSLPPKKGHVLTFKSVVITQKSVQFKQI